MSDVEYWDGQAATFDQAADHGLLAPEVREAWRQVLEPLLPQAARVADLGCGTGSLSVLLAELGHRVVGVDFAPRMIALAGSKAAAADVDATFLVGDAAAPGLAEGEFDVVLCRHVLWAMPDPSGAIGRWVRLLAPGGRLLLVEGNWWSGTGLTAQETRALLLQHRREAQVTVLDSPALWGGPIEDERYVVVSRT
jgi:ubiquinone/menaquinone biosynthesis C-methylase UbiE